MEPVKSVISKFSSVSLNEINDIALMNRIDRKFWLHYSQFKTLLEQMIPFYDILEINSQRFTDYQTTYYDFRNNDFYLDHHNGKLNRFKVRKRSYFSTGVNFFEIKLKNNKQRTVKQRIETDLNDDFITDKEKIFLESQTVFTVDELMPVLKNSFTRLTLVHKEKKDRCTFDLNLKFWNQNNNESISELVIFELKRGQGLKYSPIFSILRDMKIRHRGLSKYCLGRAILEPELKQNAFKPRLRFLYNKILN